MALVVCPKCSKQVSNQAIKCPHCGCAITSDARPDSMYTPAPKPGAGLMSKIVWVVILVAALAGVAYYFKWI